MLVIRQAGKGDGAAVFHFIHALAVYEKLDHEVCSSAATIEQALTRPDARTHAILAERDGVAVGMALYFYNFSTFLGRHGIYIEDVFVSPSERGAGIGKALLIHLAGKAVEEGCGRLEWSVLNWNEPSIAFYEGLGAKAMDEWTVYRLDGSALKALAAA